MQINLDIDSPAEAEFEVERSKFLQSVNGLEIAKLELKKLFAELKKFKDKTEKSKGLSLDYQQDQKSCTIYIKEYSIRFYMQPSKDNPIVDTYLYFELQKKGSSSNDLNILSVEQYLFDLKKVGEYGWIKEVNNSSFISSKKLAERSINQLLDHTNI